MLRLWLSHRSPCGAARSFRRLAAATLLLLPSLAILAGCSSDPSAAPPDDHLEPAADSLLAHPSRAFPASLSDVGLYPFAPDLDRVPDVAVAYEPAWPLYSNGTSKQRFVVVPDGKAVDIGERERWEFPKATLFFKTFSFERDGKSVPIETRVLRRSDDGWDYGVYQWNEQATDAELLEMDEAVPVPLVDREGAAFDHEIPSRIQCRKCHESSESFVLGFNELQLNDARADGDTTQLEELDAKGLFRGSLSDDPDSIEADDNATRDVLGYFQGNCTACHNGTGGPNSAFDLRHHVALANIIDQPTDSSASAIGIRVIPGDAEGSILYQAMALEKDELKRMPPVGVQRRDDAGIARLKDWINALEPE